MKNLPSIDQFDSIYNIVKPHVHRTPIHSSKILNKLTEAILYFKCENFQKREPLNVNDAFRSFYSGNIETNKTTNTIADGLRTQLGSINFPIIQEWVDDIILAKKNKLLML